MAADTRRKLLVTTSKLLQRQGYHGTGLNQVVAESGAPKGSLYFHFPKGKEQLAAEAVGVAADYIERAMTRQDGLPAHAALDGYLSRVITALERSNFAEGCPIATIALEMSTASDDVAQACLAALDRLTLHIAGWIEAEGVDPETARQRARLIYAAIEGALIFAKVTRSIEPIERLRGQIPHLLATPEVPRL
jgi:TetR/AcrR family transcriptional repressor of lmrAB and yxaGH operons